jgi:hypothetical protein
MLVMISAILPSRTAVFIMSSYFCSVASKVSVVYDILELKKCSGRKYNGENDTWELKVKNFAGNHVII